MRAVTRTISIAANSQKVAKFLCDPENLPRWAVGFAKGVRREKDRWLVQTGSGDVGVRIVGDPQTGVVDFWMSPAEGIEILAASRAIPRGEGSEYTFTQFQAPGMPDEIFDRNVRALEHELTVLKAIAEVECPL